MFLNNIIIDFAPLLKGITHKLLTILDNTKFVNRYYNMKQLFVSPMGDSWKVKNPDNKRASIICDTKEGAKKAATEIAKNQGLELIIQKKDGTIGEKNSFGNDPRKIHG